MNPSEFRRSLKKAQLSTTIIGGYKKKEVHAYLEKISIEWDNLVAENTSLKERLEKAENEISQLRNIETSLLSSLHKQQEANSHIIEQSKEEAKLRIARGQIKANSMVKQAEHRSREILRNADEKYQQKLTRMRSEMKILQENYTLIDQQTSHLIKEMTAILKETMLHLSKLSSLKKISVHNEFSELNSFLSDRLNHQKKVNQKRKGTQKSTTQAKPVTAVSSNKKSFFEEVEVSAN